MATTKIKPIKSTLSKALDYIMNPDKTDEKLLVSSYGCSYETADIEFEFTLSQALDKGNNLAHHLIQSFDPGETTPEQAHEIGRQLADKVLKGQYEYVLTTHIDRGHIHNHIMFCAVNFVDYHKYNSNKKTLYGIRNISDRLCRENGLSIVKPGKDKGKGFIEYTDKETGERRTRPAKEQGRSYAEYAADKAGGSQKSRLKKAIDDYIAVSLDFEDMLKRMEADGFTIKRAKYHSYKLPGADSKTRFTGGPTLGTEYTDERIRERIAGLLKAPERRTRRQSPDDGRINLIIDIQNSIKAQESRGYSQWAKIHNLKEAAKTLNFLTENNLLQYVDLQAKVEEVTAANDKTAATLKDVESRLSDMALLIKNVKTYQQTKPAYDGYRNARNKERYRREHESSLILHEAAAKSLKAARIGGKLPNVATLQTEYARLSKEKEALYTEYGKLKKQMKEYGVIKSNVDSILQQPETDKKRDIERG